MVYVAMLSGIDKKMFSYYGGMTPDDFGRRWQEVYILEFEKIKFKKLIDSSSFYGELKLNPLRKVGDKVYVECYFGFGNDKECKSFIGHVKGFIPIL